MIDPHIALKAAVGQAFDDIGLAPDIDEQLVEDFVIALKEHGYIIIQETNGVTPGKRME